jgi:FtsP/CotA-like multicopper oxidase with cupredoxin domain
MRGSSVTGWERTAKVPHQLAKGLGMPGMARIVAAALLPATALAQIDAATVGQALVQPQQVELTDAAYATDPFELVFGTTTLQTPGATFSTRTFGGGVPGPTLIFAVGATNKAKFTNAMPASPADEAHDHNAYGNPSSTNMHTHGLHIPHEVPGDDVKIVIGPATSFNYEWEVPADHLPGTHWYHPHLHGSTALQTGGGAHGMIVIRDSAGDVPDWLIATPEIQLVVHVVPQEDTTALDVIEGSSGTGTPVTQASGSANLVLVNGQNQPVISMANGVWYRWRMVFVSVHHWAMLSASGCEFGVLAKDGIYLYDAPRASDYLKFASGNRVDALIRCTADTVLAIDPTAAGGRRRRTQNAGGGAEEEMGAQTIATITVTGVDASASGGALASKQFSATMPAYLNDLREVEVHGSKDLEIAGT